LIDTGFRGNVSDARELTRLLGLSGTSRLGPRALSVLIAIDAAGGSIPGFVAGRRAHIEWSERSSKTSDDEVRVEVVEGKRTLSVDMIDPDPGTFRKVFPDATGVRGGGDNEMTMPDGLTRLTGYDGGDLTFTFPGEE
jgi:hypothetical protein